MRSLSRLQTLDAGSQFAYFRLDLSESFGKAWGVVRLTRADKVAAPTGIHAPLIA